MYDNTHVYDCTHEDLQVCEMCKASWSDILLIVPGRGIPIMIVTHWTPWPPLSKSALPNNWWCLIWKDFIIQNSFLLGHFVIGFVLIVIKSLQSCWFFLIVRS